MRKYSVILLVLIVGVTGYLWRSVLSNHCGKPKTKETSALELPQPLRPSTAPIKKDPLSTKSCSFFQNSELSEELETGKAWQALVNKDFTQAENLSGVCIMNFENDARAQQDELRSKRWQKGINNERQPTIRTAIPEANAAIETDVENEDVLPKETAFGSVISVGYKELNEVGTALFIQAESLKAQDKKYEAKQKYQEIVEIYPDAYCRDPRGWFWNVAAVAQDRIDLIDTDYDYEDYKSETLVGKAWQSLKEEDAQGVELYARKCIELYEADAQDMQGKVKRFAQGQEAFSHWALNDVATAYFILGELYFSQGNETAAQELYQQAGKYGFAQCFDLQGWHWKVAEVTKDKLDTIGTPYNFEDYKSEKLTENTWDALNKGDFKGVELYARKCIYLYGGKAIEMQQQLKDFAKDGFNPYYWALNDVGTCYFLLGKAYEQQNNSEKAKEMFQTVLNQLKFAQCWDPRGWYWKVADAAREKIEKGQ